MDIPPRTGQSGARGKGAQKNVTATRIKIKYGQIAPRSSMQTHHHSGGDDADNAIANNANANSILSNSISSGGHGSNSSRRSRVYISLVAVASVAVSIVD